VTFLLLSDDDFSVQELKLVLCFISHAVLPKS